MKTNGEYAEAERLYRRALIIEEKELGSNHPAVGAILNNFAGLLQMDGDYPQAERLYHRALAIEEKKPRPGSPIYSHRSAKFKVSTTEVESTKAAAIMAWEKVLELATHVTHPVTVTAIAVALAAFEFWLAHRARKRGLAWLLASITFLLGLAPLVLSTFVQTRGIYRVLMKASDQQPTTDAKVTSSIGGEIKRTDAGWEVDIAPQVRPANRRVTLYARRANAYQSGATTVELANDYYPETTIVLIPLPPTVIRGIVRDTLGRSVANARVSVPGYHAFVLTDEMGSFQLSAHAAEGQMIVVHTEKGDL